MNVNRKAIGLTMIIVMVLSMLIPMGFAENVKNEQLKVIKEAGRGASGFVPDELDVYSRTIRGVGRSACRDG